MMIYNRENFLAKIKTVRVLLLQGSISYEKARELAKPLVEDFNRRSIKVAKKFKQKPKKITIEGILR